MPGWQYNMDFMRTAQNGNSPSSEFFWGVRAELPILLGVAPLGMIYGVLAAGAGLSPFQAQATSSVIFAGSAQFMFVQLVELGAPAFITVLTGFIVNLRHALYSASLAPQMGQLSPLWKILLSYLLTDEVYAVTVMRYRTRDASANKHFFFLGSGLALWLCWQATTAAGIFFGAQVPPAWGLDFTLALTFIALAVPAIDDRPSLQAAASAGLTALLAWGLPYKLGLILAALAGIAAGLWSERA